MTSNFLDENKQPPIGYNFASNETKAINMLYGILMGLTADGVINDDEIHSLKIWVLNNAQYANSYPLSAVKNNIDAILVDSNITQDERDQFCARLIEIIGGSYAETGAMGGLTTNYNLDDPPDILFKNKKFCLTGTFTGHKRSDVEFLITHKGGIVQNTITLSLNYLVLGSNASRDWIGTNHGRKIESAFKIRESGGKILIINENTFFKHYKW